METENIPPLSYSGGLRQSVAYSRGDAEAAHGLPRQFIKSMRTLFDMLDDNRTGEVALREIQRRWRDDAVPNLPGVLDALRVVAPPKGLLTFDNFVSGLRLALHRSRNKNTLKTFNKVPTSEWNDLGFQRKMSTYNAMPPPLTGDNERMPWLVDEPAIFDDHVKRRDPVFGGLEANTRPGRRFRHRRSNSGPICTAKVLPNVKQPPNLIGLVTHDDLGVNMPRSIEDGAKYNFGTHESRTNGPNPPHDGPTFVYKEKMTSYQVKKTTSDVRVDALNQQKSALDQITASTLFIDRDDESSPVVSVQPVVVSGKYIGITGTLKRTKSSTSIPPQRRYGSLHRPAPRESQNQNTRPVASSSLNSLSTNANSRDCKEEEMPTATEFWMSESSDGSFGIYRKRTIRKQDSVRGETCVAENNIPNSGYGRRCNSASPPEVPVEKSARSSGRDENSFSSRTSVPVSTMSPASSTSSASTYNSSPGNEDVNAATRRRRANSASSAQRRRNARWNTAVVAFDSPTMKHLKEMQQKEDLFSKGLDSIDQVKKYFERGLLRIKSEREQLNAKVENYSTSIFPSTSIKGKPESTQSSAEVFNFLSSAVGSLGDVLRQFQKSEGPISSDSDTPCSNATSNLREQNILLTKDVSEKSDQIAQLEKEKAALVRQLFQARSELQQSTGSQANTSIFI